ncbi:hypothetical protein FAI40_08800 [Acetobacteraceae bacterium]|nr:hypothetical protein FAI40_08800 [Acetobacteraceae bacterium]
MSLLKREEEAFSYLYQKNLNLKNSDENDLRKELIQVLKESPFTHPDSKTYIAGSFVFELTRQTQEEVNRKSLEKVWKELFGKSIQGEAIFPACFNLNNSKAAESILQAAGRYLLHFKASLKRKTNPSSLLSVNRFIKFVAQNLPKLPEAKK